MLTSEGGVLVSVAVFRVWIGIFVEVERREADTTIFSRMLYRLSYLGMALDCTDSPAGGR